MRKAHIQSHFVSRSPRLPVRPKNSRGPEFAFQHTSRNRFQAGARNATRAQIEQDAGRAPRRAGFPRLHAPPASHRRSSQRPPSLARRTPQARHRHQRRQVAVPPQKQIGALEPAKTLRPYIHTPTGAPCLTDLDPSTVLTRLSAVYTYPYILIQ